MGQAVRWDATAVGGLGREGGFDGPWPLRRLDAKPLLRNGVGAPIHTDADAHPHQDAEEPPDGIGVTSPQWSVGPLVTERRAGRMPTVISCAHGLPSVLAPMLATPVSCPGGSVPAMAGSQWLCRYNCSARVFPPWPRCAGYEAAVVLLSSCFSSLQKIAAAFPRAASAPGGNSLADTRHRGPWGDHSAGLSSRQGITRQEEAQTRSHGSLVRDTRSTERSRRRRRVTAPALASRMAGRHGRPRHALERPGPVDQSARALT